MEGVEQNGELVLVRLSDMIAPYLGCESKKLVEPLKDCCKKIYWKNLTFRRQEYENEIMKFKENLPLYNQTNNIKQALLKYPINNLKNQIRMKLYNNNNKNKNFLIDLLVPITERVFINDENINEVIQFYYKKLISLSDHDFYDYFYKFIMRGKNFIVYQIQAFTGNHLKLKQYEIEKANNYITIYQEKLNNLNKN